MKQLENYLTRYREAIAPGLGECQPAGCADRFLVPLCPTTPFSREKVPTVLLATFGGLFLAIGGVVVAELAFGGGQGRRSLCRSVNGRAPPQGNRTARGTRSAVPAWGHAPEKLAHMSPPRSRVIPGAARLRFRLPWATM